ncbi:hypothetical protein ABZ234_08095 [Nocardiopsis sp. NPDC006198]|uniref:hypothetical protein n=1 Tax=Nocardiopsis sp. NPDC006198 TaxID=3154472 RepID=UPI0033A9C1BE
MAQPIFSWVDYRCTPSQARAEHVRRFHAALVLMHPSHARPTIDIGAVVKSLVTWDEDRDFPPIHLALTAYEPHLKEISRGPVRAYINKPYAELVAQADEDSTDPGLTARLHLYHGIFTPTRFTCRTNCSPDAISARALAVWAVMRTRYDHALWERARTMGRIVSGPRAAQIAPQVSVLLQDVAAPEFTAMVEETIGRVIDRG